MIGFYKESLLRWRLIRGRVKVKMYLVKPLGSDWLRRRCFVKMVTGESEGKGQVTSINLKAATGFCKKSLFKKPPTRVRVKAQIPW